MAKKKGQPKAVHSPKDKVPVLGAEPDSYLSERPVWQFQSSDWDGPWGLDACAACADWRKHIEQHLAWLETMTWAEILKASSGKKNDNNHHAISRDDFAKGARVRFGELQIYADRLFSLRLDNCTRLYGVREGVCFRIIWFDPYHCEKAGRAAYDLGTSARSGSAAKNPEVPHPRWSQASERVLGSDERVPTQLFNGYGEHVAHLYRGLDGERLFA